MTIGRPGFVPRFWVGQDGDVDSRATAISKEATLQAPARNLESPLASNCS